MKEIATQREEIQIDNCLKKICAHYSNDTGKSLIVNLIPEDDSCRPSSQNNVINNFEANSISNVY